MEIAPASTQLQPPINLEGLHTAAANSSFSEDPLFKVLVQAVNTLSQKVTHLEAETYTLNSEKNAAAAVAEAAKEIKKHKHFFFETAVSFLSDECKDRIEAITSCLRNRPYLHLILEGHGDSRSILSNNEELSRDRAETIKKRFDSELHPRLEISAKGNSALLDPINSSASVNRRVCVKVDKEKSLQAYISMHSGQSH